MRAWRGEFSKVFLKVSVFVSSWRLNGREFNAFGPENEKLRSPNFSFNCGSSYRKLLEDLSLSRPGWSATDVIMSDRFAGLRPTRTRCMSTRREIGTSVPEQLNMNWVMQIYWWLQPRAVFGYILSGIVWHMPQKFNLMSWLYRDGLVMRLYQLYNITLQQYWLSIIKRINIIFCNL